MSEPQPVWQSVRDYFWYRPVEAICYTLSIAGVLAMLFWGPLG